MKGLIVVGLVLLLLAGGLFLYQPNENSWVEKTSYCDSIKVQAGYEGEAVCYEPPENPYVKQKLVRLNK